jgi:ATP adenylyltransferase
MEYIRSEKPQGCIFCRFWEAAPAEDRANLVVHRGAHAFTCLNRFPYNSGHVMVIPRTHGAELGALGPDVWAGLQDELRRAVRVVKAVYRPDGLNLGMNLGQIAGAGITDHLHWHVVPRWAGDNNFMPVLASTRVLSQHLLDSYRRLHPLFKAIKAGLS